MTHCGGYGLPGLSSAMIVYLRWLEGLGTWSFVGLLMSRMTFSLSLPVYRGYGRIGGLFYANVSMSIPLEALAGTGPVGLDQVDSLPHWGRSGVPRPVPRLVLSRTHRTFSLAAWSAGPAAAPVPAGRFPWRRSCQRRRSLSSARRSGPGSMPV
jgi:hypothetical protein